MAVDGTTQFNVCQILVEVTGWLFLRIRSRASRKIRLGMCPVRKEQHSGVILRIRGGFRSSGQARVGLFITLCFDKHILVSYEEHYTQGL